MIAIVEKFGRALDQDDFKAAAETLSEDCVYDIGSEQLIGPIAICNSYEQNMIEGRAKMDKLEWGECRVEELGSNEYYIHFTDYLGHAGEEFTYSCKQKVTVSGDKISKIVHCPDSIKDGALRAWYDKVGIK